jgi:GNAT superfamily N-acetyltransferase
MFRTIEHILSHLSVRPREAPSGAPAEAPQTQQLPLFSRSFRDPSQPEQPRRPQTPDAAPKEAEQLNRRLLGELSAELRVLGVDISPDDLRFAGVVMSDLPGRRFDEVQTFAKNISKEVREFASVLKRYDQGEVPHEFFGIAFDAVRKATADATRKAWASVPDRRARGADALLRRLDFESRVEDSAALAEARPEVERFIAMIGRDRFDDLAFSVRRLGPTTAGQFDFGSAIISVAKRQAEGGDAAGTIIHESWHAFSQLLPEETRNALFAQYLNERKAYVKAKPEEFKPNGEMIRQYMNKRNYRYSSFDEWVAETFLDHSRRRMALVDNALRRGVMDAFLLFVDKVRAYLVDAIGYDRTAKVFDDFLRGQYSEIDARAPMESRTVRSTPLREALTGIGQDLDVPGAFGVSLGRRNVIDEIEESADGLAVSPSDGMEVVEDAPKNLLVQHNLTASNLRNVLGLGGLAAPSLAVSRVEYPLTGFGEISLLGDSRLISEPGTRVFDADVYSPRWPDNVFEVDARAAEAWSDNELAPYTRRTGEVGYGSPRDVELAALQGKKTDYATQDLRGLAGMRLKYVEEVLGQSPGKRWQLALPDGTKFGETFGSEADAIASLGRQFPFPYTRADLEVVEIEGAGGLRGERPADFRRQLDPIIEDSEGGVAAYDAWVQGQLDTLRGARQIIRRTDSGRLIRTPYTLSNIVRELTRNVRGGEGFSYGLGDKRALGAKQFSGLDEVKAARDRVVPEEEMKAAKEALDRRGYNLAERSQVENRKVENVFDLIGESYKRNRGVKAAIEEEFAPFGLFVNETDEWIGEVQQLADDLVNASTGYFEGKPSRAVQLSEFRSAVVPNDLPDDLRVALDEAGVEVVEYDRQVKGDRQAKIADTAAQQKILFQEMEASRPPVALGEMSASDLDSFIRENGSGTLLADLVGKNADDAAHRNIARHIMPYLDGVKVMSLGVGETGPSLVARGRARGLTSSSPNKPTEIWIRGIDDATSGLNVETVLHELIHAATMRRLAEGRLVVNQDTALGKAHRDLNDLTRLVIPEWKRRWQEGDKVGPASIDPDEVLAWGMTNKKFQDFLQGIKLEGNQTAFSKFVDVILDLLGLKKTEKTAFTELVRVMDDILAAPLDDLKFRQWTEKWQAMEGPDPVAPTYYSALGRAVEDLPWVSIPERVRDGRTIPAEQAIAEIPARVVPGRTIPAREVVVNKATGEKRLIPEKVIPDREIPAQTVLEQIESILLKSPDVKGDEIYWTGLRRFLEGKERVTKDEVLDFLDQNAVVVEERVLGGDLRPSEGLQRILDENEGLWSEIGPLLERDGVDVTRYGDVKGSSKAIDALLTDDPNISAEAADLLRRYADNLVLAYPMRERMRRKAARVSTQYKGYQLPGGTNYRELLFRLPQEVVGKKWQITYDDGTKFGSPFADEASARAALEETFPGRTDLDVVEIREDSLGAKYRAPHFGALGENLLAHVRLNDRLGPNGEKILFIEEIQSDWAQAGRERGFPVPPEELGALRAASIDAWVRHTMDPTPENKRLLELAQEESAAAQRPLAVERAPFVESTDRWLGLVMKRVFREAAEGGYDGVAWTKGIDQVKRYEDATRKAVDEVSWRKIEPQWIDHKPKHPPDEFIESVRTLAEAGEPGGKELLAKLLSIKSKPPEFSPGTNQATLDWDFKTAAHIRQITDGTFRVDARQPRFKQFERRSFDSLEEAKDAINKEVGAGDFAVDAYKGDRRVFSRDRMSASQIRDTLGGEMARQITESPEARGTLRGDDLTVGGEGMKGFYDRIIGAWVKKYAKRWEASPTDTVVITNPAYKAEDFIERFAPAERFIETGEGVSANYLPIPDAMRRDVIEVGQPLFSEADGTIRGAAYLDQPGRYVAEVYKTGDIGTLIHELGHLVRLTMPEEANDAWRVIIDSFGREVLDEVGGDYDKAKALIREVQAHRDSGVTELHPNDLIVRDMEERFAEGYRLFNEERMPNVLEEPTGILRRLFVSLKELWDSFWVRVRGEQRTAEEAPRTEAGDGRGRPLMSRGEEAADAAANPRDRFMQLYEAQTTPHAVDERYRVWPKGQTAVFDEFETDPSVSDIHLEMLRVFRDHQGAGEGRRILNEITRMADEAGATISLEAMAKGGPLSDADLVAWYSRSGFEPHPEWEELLVRAPVPLAEEAADAAATAGAQADDPRILRASEADAQLPDEVRAMFDRWAKDRMEVQAEVVPGTERTAGTRGADILYDADSGKTIFRVFENGDLDSLFEATGQQLNYLAGDAWAPILNGHFKDKVEAGRAFRAYLRGGRAPNSVVGRGFMRLRQGLQNVWARTRTNPDVPPEARNMWDTVLRSHEVMKRQQVEVNKKTIRAFDSMEVSIDVGERLLKGASGRAQRRAEALRIPLDEASVKAGLGIQEGQTSAPVHDVLARAIGFVAAEQFKRMAPQKMAAITERSIVPVSRLPRIKRSVTRRLDQALGGNFVEKLTELYERTAEATPATVQLGVDAGALELSDLQAANIGQLVREIAAHPMGHYLPDEIVARFGRDRSSPWAYQAGPVTLRLEEWNAITDVLYDVEAGVAAKNTSKISQPTANAFYNIIFNPIRNFSKALDAPLVPRFLATLDEAFVVKNVGEGKMNPQYQASAGRAVRGLSEAPEWTKKAVKVLRSDAPFADRYDILQGVIKMLTPSIAPSIVAPVVKTTGEVLPGRMRTLVRKFTDSENPIELKGWSSDLMDIEDILATTGINDMERKAISALDYHIRQGVALTDETMPLVEDAMQVIQRALEWRVNYVELRGKQIAMAAAGSSDLSVLKTMSWSDWDRLYHSFYTGNLPDIWDWAQSRGLQNVDFLQSADFKALKGIEKVGAGYGALKQAAFGKGFKFNPEMATYEMITRLRAMEILEDFTIELTAAGLARPGSNIPLGAGGKNFNRSKYAARVHYYINQIVHFNTMEQFSFRPPPKGQEGPSQRVIQKSPMAPTQDLWGEGERPMKWGGKDREGKIHDVHAFDEAHRILDEYGYKRGKWDWGLAELPDGSQTLMPKFLKEHLDANVQRVADTGQAFNVRWVPEGGMPEGVAVPRGYMGGAKQPLSTRAKMNMAEALDVVIENFPFTLARIQQGVTTGIGFVNAAYYTGVAFGALLQMHMGLGVKASAAALSNPRLVGSVVSRLWGQEGATWTPDAPILITPRGTAYTSDMLSDLAKQEGLKSSYIQAETAQSLARDLRQYHPDFWNRMMNFVLPESVAAKASPVKAARWWQDTLIESATAIDNYFRVGTFVEALKRGESPQSAGALARRVGLDYGALTELERMGARRVIMFYSYMRKNADLFMDTLIRHPERIAAQLRLLNGSNRAFLDEEPQIVQRDYQQGRMGVFFRDTAWNQTTTSQVAWVSPLVGINDVVALYSDVTGSLEGDEESIRRTMTRLNPQLQALIVYGTRKELFTGRDIERYNTVPGWFVEMDRAISGGMLTDRTVAAAVMGDDSLWVEWMNLEVSEKDQIPNLQGASGQPVYTARNGKAMYNFKSLVQLPGFGRSMDLITALDRSNIGVVEATVRAAQVARPGHRLMTFMDEVQPPPLKAEEDWSYTARPELVARPEMTPSEVAEAAKEPNLEELAGYLGIRPQIILSREAAAVKLYEEQERKLQESLNEEKGMQPYGEAYETVPQR